MKADSHALRILALALAVGVALGGIHLVSVIGLHVPFDPNEGWNAYFTHAAMTTGSPYPPARSLMVNNYPPLSFYIVGAITTVVCDAIVAGRIVATAALATVALGIALAARRMGCNRIEAVFAALFFTAGVMLTSDYAGMDDPQMLGHAIAICGLVLVLHEPQTPRAMVAAALLFAIAFFIKHNLVVLPLALAAWLALLDRRSAFTFAVSGIVFVLIGLGLFREVFGTSMVDVIDTARAYSFANIVSAMKAWLAWSAVPLAGTITLFAIARHDRHVMLCAIYAAIATIAGAYFSGGAGVDANTMFDADIALALGAGLLMNRISAAQDTAAIVFAVPLAIGLWSLDTNWRSGDFWMHPMAEERAAAKGEIALLRTAHGPAICEMLSLCYWAGKDAEVDVFNIGEAYRAGRRGDADLVSAIDARRFGMIQFEEMSPFPLTENIRRAVDQHYRLVRKDDDRTFFAPR
ncbi:MAG TPA: glycosyltransferase family 39 protein [Rhizomicrobium sp.]|nr:glycosyltransferase family 39 protein [Rhizomicrobium sp.]